MSESIAATNLFLDCGKGEWIRFLVVDFITVAHIQFSTLRIGILRIGIGG